jgi:hypothetical protein
LKYHISNWKKRSTKFKEVKINVLPANAIGIGKIQILIQCHMQHQTVYIENSNIIDEIVEN